MHQTRIRGACVVLAIATSLCLLAAPAISDDRPWEAERWYTTYGGFSSSVEDFSSAQRWLQPQFSAEDGHAFEYRRGLSLNLEENFFIGIHSPPAGEWAPSLAFELRF